MPHLLRAGYLVSDGYIIGSISPLKNGGVCKMDTLNSLLSLILKFISFVHSTPNDNP